MAEDTNRPEGFGDAVCRWANADMAHRALDGREARLEENARAALAASLNALEDERERLALEIHDRMAHLLAAVFQQLQMVESLAQSLPDIRQVAERGSLLCREAIREARDIMADLSPPALQEIGLIPLVEEELRRLREGGRRVHRRLRARAQPPKEVELTLYRIFQEALINLRRHADASEVSVTLDCGPEVVRLSIADDGVGFDLPTALAAKRVGGLVGMLRRAELAGGTCQIDSQPGRGTTVTVRIPVKAEVHTRP